MVPVEKNCKIPLKTNTQLETIHCKTLVKRTPLISFCLLNAILFPIPRVFLHIFFYFAGNHESESARYRCRSARFFLLQPFRFVLVTRREMHTRTRTTISPFSFKFIFPRCSFSRFQYVGRRKKERRRSDPLPDRSGSGGERKRETGKEEKEEEEE